jgi:hypothetical protein
MENARLRQLVDDRSALSADLPATGFTGRYSGWIDLPPVHNGLLMNILHMMPVFWKRHPPGVEY